MIVASSVPDIHDHAAITKHCILLLNLHVTDIIMAGLGR
jgi:hypothetical protein